VNYPYPNYENGDLFLSWAELGTRCYAEKHPEIALKYIRNVIARYDSDGLGHQRYKRVTQTGAGDDILSNNIMAVVGLYRNIYGIRPRHNRLYLEPHLTTDLNGTRLKYWLRNQVYMIGLSAGEYSIHVNHFTVTGAHPFAVHSNENILEYFDGDEDHFSLRLSGLQSGSVNIQVWTNKHMRWEEKAEGVNGKVHHELHNLSPNAVYQLTINGMSEQQYTAGPAGSIRFDHPAGKKVLKMEMTRICKTR
jgi:hypothetical protein